MESVQLCRECYRQLIRASVLDRYDVQALRLLKKGDKNVRELRDPMKISQILITRVLAKLVGSLAVRPTVEGRASVYTLTAGGKQLLQEIDEG